MTQAAQGRTRGKRAGKAVATTEAVEEATGLDFILLGVARSGMGTLARALNLDPAIFCAAEYFHEAPAADLARARLPDAFLDETWQATTARNTALTRDTLRAKLEAAGKVRAFGNRHPGYALTLEAVNAAIPGLRNLCVLRGPGAIAASWDRRAANPRDTAWPSGRIGLYGLVSWLLLVSRLVETRLDRLWIVDHHACFAGDPAVAEQVYRCVLADGPSAGVMDRFRAEMFGAVAAAPAEGPHDALLRGIGAPALEARLAAEGFAPLAALRDPLRDFVAEGFEPIGRHLGDWIEANAAGRPDVLDYGWRWATGTLQDWDAADSPTFAVAVPLLAGFLRRLVPLDPALAARHLPRVRKAAERMPDGMRRHLVALLRAMPRPAEAGKVTPAASGRRPPAQVKRAGQHAMQARALSREGQHAEALAEARLAEAAVPDELRYRTLLADMLIRAGETAEAETVIAAELARFPEDAVLLRLRSRLLVALDRLEEAAEVARAALDRAPADPAAQRWLERVEARQAARDRAAAEDAEEEEDAYDDDDAEDEEDDRKD